LGHFILKLYFFLRAGAWKWGKASYDRTFLSLCDARYKLLMNARRDRDVVRSTKIVEDIYSSSLIKGKMARSLSVIAADLDLDEVAQALSTECFKLEIAAEFDVFLEDSKSFISLVIGDVQVSYSFAVGNENIGCLICKSDTGIIRSFGKIVRLGGGNVKEVDFYRSMVRMLPELEEFTPKCFGIYERPFDNVVVIFMDSLSKSGLGQKRIGGPAITIGTTIESIDYHRALQIFSVFPLDYSKPFGRIFHFKYGCEFALAEIRRGFSDRPSVGVLKVFETLEKIFLRRGAYRLIDREKHYALCHNDFHWRNLHYENGQCKVFDWSTFSIGLRGWDIATYFSDCEFSFEEIHSLYIKPKFDLNRRNDQIQLMFFCFALLLVIALRHRRNCESLLDDFFVPATDVIKNMYQKLDGVVF